ncbi:hypothetical protein ROZALSC1DRAFT_28756 [Rozella allomycis CSF55]|uniref:Uncharacterized protein n=1 Tax=Rozella allomycis (strain CSF55) TaxID=988480 RepID=A0A4P9YJT1_ROZAC|nr:hypothetical protein ROZALSC1DRAFT_28756 [Rozella allomycis CSF55]
MSTKPPSRPQSPYSSPSKPTDSVLSTLLSAKNIPYVKKENPSCVKKDLPSIILLIMLCIIQSKFEIDLMQGIPAGLALGTLPYLLKSRLDLNLTYSDLALFSIAGYPYSFKILWSPIVDAIFSKILVFLAATQDIAVDGWALTILSRENLRYASTCQTIGLSSGYFISFTLFLAFNSSEFANLFRAESLDYGFIDLGGFSYFWGAFGFFVTLIVLFYKEGNNSEDVEGITQSYKTMLKIVKLPNMCLFLLVLLLCKIGFIGVESSIGYKMLDKGFKKEYTAITVLIDFPFQLVSGYYAAKWTQGNRPLKPFLWGGLLRLSLALWSIFLFYNFPEQPIPLWFTGLVMMSMVAVSFTSNVMFVSMGAFFAQISDPVIGGTYMTILNTFSNLGGTWPKFFVLESIDYLTKAECSVRDPISNSTFSCIKNVEQCSNIGGVCNVSVDGFFPTAFVTLAIGGVLFVTFIKRAIKKLERVPHKEWRVFPIKD